MSNDIELKEPNASVFGDGISLSILSKLDFAFDKMTSVTKELIGQAVEMARTNSKAVVVATFIGGTALASAPASADWSNLNNVSSGTAIAGLAVNMYELANNQAPTTQSLQNAQIANQVGNISGNIANRSNAGLVSGAGTILTYGAMSAIRNNNNNNNTMRQENVYGQYVLIDSQNRVFDANTRQHIGSYSPQYHVYYNLDGSQVMPRNQQLTQQQIQQGVYIQPSNNSDLANKFDQVIQGPYDTAVQLYALGHTKPGKDGEAFRKACSSALGSMDRATNVGLGQRYMKAQATLYQMGCSVPNMGMMPN